MILRKYTLVIQGFLLIILVFTVILFLSRVRWVQMWLIIEINLLVFLWYINRIKDNNIIVIKYYLVQALCSLLIVWTFISPVNIWLSGLFMLVLIKLGVLPFHFWIISLAKLLYKDIYFVLLTVQKLQIIILFIIIVKQRYISIFIIIMLLCYIIILYEYNSKIFFLFSSISFTILFVLMGLSRIKYSLGLWIAYICFLIVFFLFDDIYNLINKQSNMVKLICLLVLAGFPPFSIFLYKVEIISFLWVLNNIFVLLFLLFSLIALYVYYKLIFHYFINYSYPVLLTINSNMVLVYILIISIYCNKLN